MDMNFEQKVREKAYEIWMAAGMEDGAAHDHWVAAEQVVITETVVPKKTRKAAAPKTATPAVKAKSPAKARAKAPAKANAKGSSSKH